MLLTTVVFEVGALCYILGAHGIAQRTTARWVDRRTPPFPFSLGIGPMTVTHVRAIGVWLVLWPLVSWALVRYLI